MSGDPGRPIPLERLVRGCGVDFLEIHDPYDIAGLVRLLKRAHQYVRSPEGGVAVVIARHPCLIADRGAAVKPARSLAITERCRGCRHCIDAFECPALLWDPVHERVSVSETLCTRCGVCVGVCPKGAIRARGPLKETT